MVGPDYYGSPSIVIRVFAICQILMGWKTCKYYYETDELPNPKANPTQGKIRLKVWRWGHFFPKANIFSWVGIDFI